MHWTIWLFIISLIIVLPLAIILRSITFYDSWNDHKKKLNGTPFTIPYWVLLLICVGMVVPILNLILSIIYWIIYIHSRAEGCLEYVDFDSNRLPDFLQKVVTWLTKEW